MGRQVECPWPSPKLHGIAGAANKAEEFSTGWARADRLFKFQERRIYQPRRGRRRRLLRGFCAVGHWRRRPGEDLKEDAPWYKPVVIDQKTEGEAGPKHKNAKQERIDDGPIRIAVLETRYH